jgi:ABC-type Fe3+-siderophore transport system permease subunit
MAFLISRGLRLSVCGLLCFFLSSNAYASSVTLAWDPSSDLGVAGYFVYVGTASGSYSVQLDAGNYTTATVSALVAGYTYYFAVMSYDMYGDESSLFSPEVSVAIPVLSDTSPPPSRLRRR